MWFDLAGMIMLSRVNCVSHPSSILVFLLDMTEEGSNPVFYAKRFPLSKVTEGTTEAAVPVPRTLI